VGEPRFDLVYFPIYKNDATTKAKEK